MTSTPALALALALALSLVASATALAAPGAMQGACGNDLRALCASVSPGGGRIRDCMREHREQLSQACKVEIADRMLARQARASQNGSATIRQVPAESVTPVPRN